MKKSLQGLYTRLIGAFCCLLFSSQIAFADGGEKAKFNPGDMIMHHIADSHEWHFFSIGETHITLPLPVILYTDKGLDVFMSSAMHHAKKVQAHHHAEVQEGEVENKDEANHHHAQLELTTALNTYIIEHDKFRLKNGGTLIDLSITKNVASMFVSVILLLTIFTSIARAYQRRAGQAPQGLQSMFETIIVFLRDEVVKPNIGDKYERYFPYLLTLFFFIWFNNMLGLLPGGANLTGNIAVTLTLAVLTLLITVFSAKGAFWGHIFNPPGVPFLVKFILVPVEIIGIFTKPFSLMVRLFANITAGHIIILSLISLVFIFEAWAIGIFSSLFALAMNCLEMFVAILQAYIFTLLTSMYIGQAVEEHHHHDDHAHEGAHH